MKCCDLRILLHFGEILRFTHFNRHKFLAPRRFQLFCTPVCRVPLIVFHNLNSTEKNLVLIIVASVTGSASVNFVKWEDFFTMNAKGTNAFTLSRSYWLSAWVTQPERPWLLVINHISCVTLYDQYFFPVIV